VQIQPGDLNQVELLLIKSDPYGDATHPLSYKVGQSTVALDSLQTFIGKGATSLLGSKPDILSFTNKLDNKDATVQILVGRKAM
jgi:hypothetical protein